MFPFGSLLVSFGLSFVGIFGVVVWFGLVGGFWSNVAQLVLDSLAQVTLMPPLAMQQGPQVYSTPPDSRASLDEGSQKAWVINESLKARHRLSPYESHSGKPSAS